MSFSRCLLSFFFSLLEKVDGTEGMGIDQRLELISNFIKKINDAGRISVNRYAMMLAGSIDTKRGGSGVDQMPLDTVDIGLAEREAISLAWRKNLPLRGGTDGFLVIVSSRRTVLCCRRIRPQGGKHSEGQEDAGESGQ